MIQGIILDIDGVIIGSIPGVNSPRPHPEVIEALSNIRKSWLFISLCTAKPQFAIYDIIEVCGLNNLHITDGGWVIIDPLDEETLRVFNIDEGIANEVIDLFISKGVYTEFYTQDDYFIQSNQRSAITEDHYKVLQKYPKEVDRYDWERVTKIMPIARDKKEKDKIVQLFEPFTDKLTLSWWFHPVVNPLEFGIVTARGISKSYAAKQIADREGVSMEHLLGVGDSTSDWQFIQNCGYKVAMWNASQELKDLVLDAGWFVASDVDENGILEVFEHFGLASSQQV